MAAHPAERPIDCERDLVLFRGGDHAIRISDRGGERLLDQHVDAMRGDALDIFGMASGGRAEDHEVGFRLLNAVIDVGEGVSLNL